VYDFYVTATDTSGNESAASATVQIQTSASQQLPAAPSSPAVVAVNESTVTFTWVDNATNEDEFIVERATASAGPFTELGRPAADSTSFQDATTSQDTTYYYRVAASNAAGASAYTPVTSLTTPIDYAGTSIQFTQGTASNHDLRQYYLSEIPAGHTVVSVSIASGTLPGNGSVVLNSAQERLEYDGLGLVDTELNIDIEVTTQADEITTFTLFES